MGLKGLVICGTGDTPALLGFKNKQWKVNQDTKDFFLRHISSLALMQLYEGPDKGQNWWRKVKGLRRKKTSTAGTQTHDLCIMSRAVYRCATATAHRGFLSLLVVRDKASASKWTDATNLGKTGIFAFFCQNLKCKRSQRVKRRIFAKSCLENIFRPPLNLKPQKSYLRPQGRVALLLNGSRYLASDLVREESVMTGDLKF